LLTVLSLDIHAQSGKQYPVHPNLEHRPPEPLNPANPL